MAFIWESASSFKYSVVLGARQWPKHLENDVWEAWMTLLAFTSWQSSQYNPSIQKIKWSFSSASGIAFEAGLWFSFTNTTQWCDSGKQYTNIQTTPTVVVLSRLFETSTLDETTFEFQGGSHRWNVDKDCDFEYSALKCASVVHLIVSKAPENWIKKLCTTSHSLVREVVLPICL